MVSKRTELQAECDRKIGLRIREVRVGLRMTTQQLGKALGVSHVTVVNIEQGQQSLSLGRLMEVAIALNTTWMNLAHAITAVTCTHCNGKGYITPTELEPHRQ